MTSKQLTVITCDNGLGHIRRVVATLNIIHESIPTLKTDLFISESKCKKLRDWPTFSNLKSNKQCIFHNIEFGPPTAWIKEPDYLKNKLSAFQDFMTVADVVWSDNIIETLQFRKDTVLSGSFLWHEVLEYITGGKEYATACRALLSATKPVMIGTSVLATPDVRNLTHFKGVGLYRYSTKQEAAKKDGILMSCGLTGACNDEMRRAISIMLNDEFWSGYRIFVEPDLFPENSPSWFSKATYDAAMFARLHAGCIRPGMGTLSDMLLSGARPFMLHEENFEMRHNATTLKNKGLGQYATDAADAVGRMKEYLNDDTAQRHHYDKAQNIDDNGVESTAELICDILKG